MIWHRSQHANLHMWFPKRGCGFSTSKLNLPAELGTVWIMTLDTPLSSSRRMEPDRTWRKVLTYRYGLVSLSTAMPQVGRGFLKLLESLQWPLPLLTLGFSALTGSGFGESHWWKRSGDGKLDWVGSVLGYKQEVTKASECWVPTWTQFSLLTPARCVSHTQSVQLSNHLPHFSLSDSFVALNGKENITVTISHWWKSSVLIHLNIFKP